MMTTEWQPTREMESYVRLLDEYRESISEAGRIVFGEAQSQAYKEHMVRSYGVVPQEYVDAMQKMLLAATKLTNQDRTLLAELVHAAQVAAASIDPDDATPFGHRVYAGDVHRYYRRLSGMVEEILLVNAGEAGTVQDALDSTAEWEEAHARALEHRSQFAVVRDP